MAPPAAILPAPDPGSSDLPVPVTRSAPKEAPARRAPEPAPFELPSILDAPLPGSPGPLRPGARAFGDIALDLPPPPMGVPSAPLPEEADLPALASAALPSPVRGAPSVHDIIGLPSPVEAGLPSPAHASLPSPARASLPAVASASLPAVSAGSLPVVSGGSLPVVSSGSLPSPATAEGFPTSSPGLPEARSFTPWPDQEPGVSFGERNTPEITLPDGSVRPAPLRSVAPSQRTSDALDGFELVEPSAVEDVPLQAVSQAPPPVRGAALSNAAVGDWRESGEPRGPGRGRRALRAVGVIAVLGALGGGALTLLPDVGPFGAYWILDRVRAGEYRELVAETVTRATGRLERDTFSEARAALAEIESVRARSARVRPLAAYAAFVGFLRELRFGNDPEVHASAAALLDGLVEDSAEYGALARAARAAADGQLARARQLLGGAGAPRERAALQGEIELRARDSKAALLAFGELAKLEDGARAAFGSARARFAAGDTAGAERDAERALGANPGHVGARILKARLVSARREEEPQAISALEAIVKDPRGASPAELVEAHTLLGDIHFERSRVARAEAAYSAAIAVQPRASRALIGLGEALYRAGRYSEAQARFEAGAQADPGEVSAEVGVAKSKLKLERISEAHGMLEKLYATHPKDLAVLYWYGRALEALGNGERAEKLYREAIEQGKPEDPLFVESYVALALLQDRAGHAEDAERTLAAARERLPQSAGIQRALGEVALTHGRYSEAAAEFGAAIRTDPEDLLARFRLGTALRHDGKLEDSGRAFEALAAADPEYPGLALERGLLYEAMGRPEEALRAYEGALAKAPTDPDLVLRVGCGYAVAGRSKEALALLRKLLVERPDSAEANYCNGRAVLAEGSRQAEALRYFERAVDLDPNKAEHRLYVGWAANESGDFPKAEKALDEAIRLAPGLADAYAQRGLLRARQGAVREAISDLTRALTLRPNLPAANAALADAYYDSGKESLALAEWKKATSAQPDNATWRFRYGKLLAANQMNDAARVELGAALELVEKNDLRERWIPEAHLFLARSLGARPEAAAHWESFLKLGPSDSPYREEAKASLQRLGKPWSE